MITKSDLTRKQMDINFTTCNQSVISICRIVKPNDEPNRGAQQYPRK